MLIKRTIHIIIILLVIGYGCGSTNEENSEHVPNDSEIKIPFDQSKWSIKEGQQYPFRDQMVDDILFSDTVRFLKRNEVIELFGEPDRENEGHLYYTVDQKRLFIWPLHTKTLVIKISDTNSVEWIKLHE